MRHRNFYRSRLEVEHIAFALIPCTDSVKHMAMLHSKESEKWSPSLVPQRKVQTQEASRNLCSQSTGLLCPAADSVSVALLMRAIVS